MLHVITVDSVLEGLREAFRYELIHQIGKGQVARYYENKLGYWEWKSEGRIVLDADYASSNVKASSLLFPFLESLADKNKVPAKDLWSYNGKYDQVWIIERLTEGTLRKIRQMEKDGKIKYTCLFLHREEPFNDGEKEEAYKELKRVLKASQNGRIDVTWMSWGYRGTEQVHKLLYNESLDQYKLPRLTSAEEQIETPLSQILRQYYSDLKGREIHWYPKKYVHKAMDEEKWGVDPLPKKKQGSVKRHVLVTGTGRSGTTYFSDLLTLLGLDVGHQRNGKDGCSGAEFAVDHDWYPWFPVYGGGDCANVGERRSDYDYKHILHIVRHPLRCIPSLMRNYPAINPEFWADNGSMDPSFMDKSSIVRNAAMYYAINKRIDESGQAEYRCQLEKIHERWGTLMEILELKGTPDPKLGATNKATGWGQYEPLTWQGLENQVGSTLAKSIYQQAKEYGY
jgi:hypothetical protein